MENAQEMVVVMAAQRDVLSAPHCALQVVKVTNCMLCLFYHNCLEEEKEGRRKELVGKTIQVSVKLAE